ncbi:triphosphoribosyl-dephospho-CoA synthase [Limosilactobacillus fermentum]|uniref:triphosphoribosyl-dephospho-CoA synthase n=1 Tax=Limosilactobacillus fermentum TaxID=1613 RepID=UPI0021CB38D3|nr:triphosphoribosyl-dephospho-CoA synthase [Limosilactobacillus fermentum]
MSSPLFKAPPVYALTFSRRKQAATAGLNFPTEQPAPLFFNQLRLPGQRAETTMFKATAGVNTHKGTIFSLGILTGTVATLKGPSVASYPVERSTGCQRDVG